MKPDLEQLQHLLGDQETCKKYIQMFLRDMPGILDAIQTSIAAGHWTEGSRWAHTFRSQMLMVGHPEAAELAENIERQCKTEHPDVNMLSEDVQLCRNYLEDVILTLQRISV